MKRFLKGVFELKTNVSLGFTAAALIYMAVTLFLGEEVVSIWRMLQLLLLCVIGGVLQACCFGGKMFRRLSYAKRLMLFGVVFLLVLAAFALGFGWLPWGNPGAWLLFVGIFLVLFAALTAVFELCYKLAGRRYDGLLGAYKAQREREKQHG